MKRFLAVMNNPETKLRGMPASVWVWERRFSEHFAPPKSRDATVVVNNTPVFHFNGEPVTMDSWARVTERARRLVDRAEPKQLTEGSNCE
jgi:hypothetical protein